MSMRFLFLALMTSLSLSAWAVPQATVEAVVAPAWLDRDGRTQPLAPGMEIRSGDRIRTGDGARALLTVAEGSAVKLGERAQLGFISRSLNPREFFRGALDIAVGAFRFTTSKLAKARGRDVAIRVGTATIGIRGTDVWGKTDKDRDLVMLIEGSIELRRNGEAIDLTEPMTAYVAPKDAGTHPVIETVTADDFVARAAETEIADGAGAVRNGGKWRLQIGRVATEGEALSLYDTVRSAGFPARVQMRAEGGEWRYEVSVAGFVSQAEAIKGAARLKAVTGLEPEAMAR